WRPARRRASRRSPVQPLSARASRHHDRRRTQDCVGRAVARPEGGHHSAWWGIRGGGAHRFIASRVEGAPDVVVTGVPQPGEYGDRLVTYCPYPVEEGVRVAAGMVEGP